MRGNRGSGIVKAIYGKWVSGRQHTVADAPKRSRTNEKKTIPATDILMEGNRGKRGDGDVVEGKL